jgi:predicted metal-dependent enzyme (double-stranded beta helix superfamily)
MFDSTDSAAATGTALGTSAPPRALRPLVTLCAALDAALDAPATEFATRLHRAMSDAVGARDWLPHAHRAASPEHYCRHVLAADPQGRYTVVSLVWMPGQASPVHGHLAWCVYAIVAGELSETPYRYDATSAAARPMSSRPRRPGEVWFAQPGLTAIHRLGHADPAGTLSEPAVSQHVYGVARDDVGARVNHLIAVA